MKMWENPRIYAVKHKNIDVRMASRSGGIFTALSDEIFESKGVVYGCILTENFEAVHVRAERPEVRDQMRGSKYVQSNMQDVFVNVREDLEGGKNVLFTGTSCQIVGLRAFLQKEYLNLLCVDIVCHGVPSPLVWKKYLQWQEKKYGRCVSVEFRNKKDYGWKAAIETLILKDEKGKLKKVDSRVFTTLFYKHSVLRPSCYSCPYRNISHPGDITIADYWGIERIVPDFQDNKGVSLVFVNNEQGMKIFEKIVDVLEYKETVVDQELEKRYRKQVEKPQQREQFWREFQKASFDGIAKEYGEDNWKNTIWLALRKIKKCLKI